MARVFAIGDIHGCCKTFKKLIQEVIKIEISDTIYCLGDYVNRGIDSKGVIDFILELRSKGHTIQTLRGNHEQLMLDVAKNPEKSDQWFKNGGKITLDSFGISSIKELPGKYIDFLNETKFYIQTMDYVFVHAGLNFALRDPFSDIDAMLNTRETYFVKEKINNRTLIHGHSPASLKSILNPVNTFNINIDGGCVKNHRDNFGNLIALSLPEMKFFAVQNID